MSEIKWGYSRRGGRRHRLGDDVMKTNEGACCGLTPSACCLLGDALCGVLLEGEISEKNLQYWLACQHCERVSSNVPTS